MIATHIHHALSQIEELKTKVLQTQSFTGYSGRCRIIGGTIAFCVAFVMSTSWYPSSATVHLITWIITAALAGSINYAAVIYWYFNRTDKYNDLKSLMPAIETLPILFVGGVFTGILVHNHQMDMLFGTWMCLFGLVNMTARHSLPKALYALGGYYILCGTFCLLTPWGTFAKPWTMGVIFGVGEWVGGLIFTRHRIKMNTNIESNHEEITY